MRNAYYKLLLSLVAFLIASTCPTLAFKKTKEQHVQEKCQTKGSYKLIVTNGFDHIFFVPIGETGSHLIRAGATHKLEVSKNEIGKLMEWLNELGLKLDFLPGDKETLKTVLFQTDPTMPEYEKFSLDIEYCLKGDCNIRKYSFKNCDGHFIMKFIKGHPYACEEAIKEVKEGKTTVLDFSKFIFYY